MSGGRPITDSDIKEFSPHPNIKSLSKAIATGEATTKDVEGMKPVFRLHPLEDPRDGGIKSILSRRGSGIQRRGDRRPGS